MTLLAKKALKLMCMYVCDPRPRHPLISVESLSHFSLAQLNAYLVVHSTSATERVKLYKNWYNWVRSVYKVKVIKLTLPGTGTVWYCSTYQ